MTMKIRLILGLSFLLALQPALAAETCQATRGIAMINQPNPDLSKLNQILSICDKTIPNDIQVLLLHGLIARKMAETTQNYTDAINWFEKAKATAGSGNLSPTLELALTYEWAGNIKKAQALYDEALSTDSTSRPALFGKARTEVAQNNIAGAKQTYQRILQDNPVDDEARQNLEDLNVAGADLKVGRYCHANEALRLLNLAQPPMLAIEKMIENCDKTLPNNPRVLLLHGLYERKKALTTKNYQLAIQWLGRTIQKTSASDIAPSMELAVTYEWANDPTQAKAIYDTILAKKPRYRPALFGLARVALAENRFDDSAKIYQEFLDKNAQDIEALNGLARIDMAKKQYDAAREKFKQVLIFDAKNADALIGLQQLSAAVEAQAQLVKNEKRAALALPKKVTPLCEANKGLVLLNQTHPNYSDINDILTRCDKNTPDDVQALLLHGLVERKKNMNTGQYQTAITWLQKAAKNATLDNPSPKLELAVTYEWNNEPQKAGAIYQDILHQDPTSYPALLGMGRVYRAEYNVYEAKGIYNYLLIQKPNDVDALNGLAWTQLTDKQVTLAKGNFSKALRLQPNNTDAQLGLKLSNELTRYILSVNGGRYSVSNAKSYTSNINYYADLNATDQFIMQLTHNSNEIQLSFVLDPTVLPKNSAFFGFQRQYPNRYGWGINYEYRERTQLRAEHRIGANANVFLFHNFQWLVGAREGLPSPWNNQLYYSRFTLFTHLPVDVSLTGYWGHQQVGGGTSSYVLDLSKEFANRAYYDIGASYSPSQLSWETHANVILPILKNQSLESAYEHLYFNGTTAISIGWRIYW